jgi:hypothetical protein
MKRGSEMGVVVKVLLILFTFAMPVFAGKDAPVFTDGDIEKYGGSTQSDTGTSMQEEERGRDHYVSPQESDLRRRKDDVARENRDYIEGQYQWMKSDCYKYEGEFRKDCLFRTEEWRKEQLRQVEDLKEYLG